VKELTCRVIVTATYISLNAKSAVHTAVA